MHLVGPGVSLAKSDSSSSSKIGGDKGGDLREQVGEKKLPDGFHILRKAQSKTICWRKRELWET